MKNIILGVTGSIAAYKAAYLTNALTKRGYNVDVIITKGGMEFITPLTLQTLSKNRVYTDTFELDYPREVKHISLSKKADLFLIAPATANIIGKIANGIGDDMLTSVALAMTGIPMLIAPAMNTRMWENPIVQENIKKLKKYGYQFIEPREAILADGDLGKGALAEVEEILKSIESALQVK
ncbi:phosphopantothenoylcysteine decarboxylase [Anaerocolumna sp. AGMB13025]|uniref:phosphopantothenoylcysteine decarboxylase n=1 Tax=Anaerocolumna sp. AGMB13025 TaxID=3039116 RepID=UPI00241FFA45|nr:phosphopantothenoylcysteine decarboxylase [Anaerocolumna sp. AGMB13025]WFR58924.1 phosphopantothenoylcysteine decarboxylase [Anaerocolumna sp. AGMB13025]